MDVADCSLRGVWPVFPKIHLVLFVFSQGPVPTCASSDPRRLRLYPQGGGEQDKHISTLVPRLVNSSLSFFLSNSDPLSTKIVSDATKRLQILP
jgi:hypothetical protein